MKYQPKLPKEIRCPLEYGLDIFGCKWKSRILCMLDAYGTRRYSELRREILDVSDTVLAQSLKELQADGLIVRRQFEAIPPKVEYSLSKKGEGIIPILQQICIWAGQYYEENNQKAPEHCRFCGFRPPRRSEELECVAGEEAFENGSD